MYTRRELSLIEFLSDPSGAKHCLEGQGDLPGPPQTFRTAVLTDSRFFGRSFYNFWGALDKYTYNAYKPHRNSGYPHS